LRMRSRKDGTEPVVSALTRGIVTVGGVAWAVKGTAEPSLIKLLSSQFPFAVLCWTDIPLHVTHRAVLSKDEIAPQRIDNHEDHLVEWRMGFSARLFLLAAIIFPIRETRQDGLIGKESSREDQDRNWEQEVGEREASLADAMRKRHGVVQLVAQAIQEFQSANHLVCVGRKRG
jgi:hypothetical protein